MRVVAQRVSRARVTVESRSVAEIGGGLLLLVGFAPDDDEGRLRWMSEKLWGLRIFPDDEGRMNRSVRDVGGALLVVSQFTLYGDVSRGKRPSFVGAAAPDLANRLYDRFLEILEETDGRVERGEFGALMQVELVNEGPVTILLERGAS